MNEQAALAGVAVDVVFDQRVASPPPTRRSWPRSASSSARSREAVQNHPELVQEVPRLRGAVHRQLLRGAELARSSPTARFCFIPKGVNCPMDLSHLLPHQHRGIGPVRAHPDRRRRRRYVSYLEGCTAPKFDTNQLHAAVVELVALDDADIKYSTVQNWYAGDKNGRGGIFNFVTKRGLCEGRLATSRWTQVETGSGDHLEVPQRASCWATTRIGEFYSVALTNHHQQADTGTKMIHIGKNTEAPSSARASRPGTAQQHLSRPGEDPAEGRRRAQLLAVRLDAHRPDQCSANTFPYIEVQNPTAQGGARGLDLEDRRGAAVLLRSSAASAPRTPSP